MHISSWPGRIGLVSTALAVLCAASASPGAAAATAAKDRYEAASSSRERQCVRAARRRGLQARAIRRECRRSTRHHLAPAAAPGGTAPEPSPAAGGPSSAPGVDLPAADPPGEGSSGAPPATEGEAAPEAPTGEGSSSFRFFAPTSPWNEALEDGTPLDLDSGLLAGAFATEVSNEIQTGRGPSISTSSYGVSLYTVPADQPTVPVQLISPLSDPALDSALSAVPLPESARPAAGSDGHLVVWQPSTDRLWEFWRLTRGAGGWQASWGGAIHEVSTNSGTYGPSSWAGASRSWGASASSLSIAAGLITFEDLARGSINHALAIGIPNVRGGVYAWPAARTDGGSLDPTSLPEGAHLRLDPSLNLTSMHMPPLTLMLAEAAQRYGIIVRDGAANVTFYAQAPSASENNPFAGPSGYLEGKYPARLLASFPWRHLQLLPMELSAEK
jgi:hypothetical protein